MQAAAPIVIAELAGPGSFHDRCECPPLLPRLELQRSSACTATPDSSGVALVSQAGTGVRPSGAARIVDIGLFHMPMRPPICGRVAHPPNPLRR